MGKQWPKTPEQAAFLVEQAEIFKDAQDSKRLEPARAHLYKSWFARWPERLTLFPDLVIDAPLSDTQYNELTLAIKRRKRVSTLV
jgi:hypothetical protein